MIAVEYTLAEAQALVADVPGAVLTLQQMSDSVRARQKVAQAVAVETGPGGSEMVGENPPLPRWLARARQTDRAAA